MCVFNKKNCPIVFKFVCIFSKVNNNKLSTSQKGKPTKTLQLLLINYGPNVFSRRQGLPRASSKSYLPPHFDATPVKQADKGTIGAKNKIINLCVRDGVDTVLF